MSDLAIAFPAEVAAPIARNVIDAATDGSVLWMAAGGLLLVILKPLCSGIARAWHASEA